MKYTFHSILPLSLAATAGFALDSGTVDFAHQVVPVLREHCFECHGGDKSKGGFSINSRNLLLDGDVAIPGNAAESYLFELIEDPDPEFRMPANKRPPVPPDQVAILKRWVNEGMVWEPGFTFGESAYEPPLLPRLPELPEAVDGREHPIDRLIDAYLAKGGYPRPEPIDDSTFLRRISLDLVGLLPPAGLVRDFLADDTPDKRERLIDELLARDIDYTEHWLTFWNDLLRNDYHGTGFTTGGRKQISAWLYESLKANKPFDVMVRELIAPPDDGSSGFIGGIQWRGTVSAGQSLPVQFSQSVSQSFLGINMKCASCHDSFIDRWTLAEAYGLAAVFSEEPLELYRCDKPTGIMAEAAWPFPEIGQVDPAAAKEDRLKQLADLFTHPDNGRVPRTIVNRLWGQMMGRGIVHPLDAMGTEPWNADLLDWLAADFQAHGYDMKRILRLITTSQAYQSRGAISDDSEETGEFVYRGPSPKRLTAEQFVDAVWQVSGAAPPSFDAPVARASVQPAMVDALSVESTWVWGPSVDDGGVPLHGEKILLRRELKPAGPVHSATIVAAADNAFVLYWNGEEILNGTNWNELMAASLANRLKEDNRILIVAENRGPKPNPAGVFCAVRIEYVGGDVEIVVTDDTWQVSETVPTLDQPNELDLDALDWEIARILSDTTWKEKTDARTGKALATAIASSDRMVRSSLLKADALMRSLGRPNRDQIVTSRPSELTALEALELSTSPELIGILGKGADKLLEAGLSGDRDALIEEIYLNLLSRYPARKEVNTIRQALGRNPDADILTDLLWALVMTPEFFIIR